MAVVVSRAGRRARRNPPGPAARQMRLLIVLAMHSGEAFSLADLCTAVGLPDTDAARKSLRGDVVRWSNELPLCEGDDGAVMLDRQALVDWLGVDVITADTVFG